MVRTIRSVHIPQVKAMQPIAFFKDIAGDRVLQVEAMPTFMAFFERAVLT